MNLKDTQLVESHRRSAERIEFLCSILEEIGDYEIEEDAKAHELRSALRYITRIAHKAVA